MAVIVPATAYLPLAGGVMTGDLATASAPAGSQAANTYAFSFITYAFSFIAIG